MGRLIDADALIDMLLTENQRCITSTNHELSVNMVVSFIKNQQTAYDVEKVVEQIENMHGVDAMYYGSEVRWTVDKAIEIVRKGGAE